MSDFKNLDRLFKEKLKNFEVNVPQNNWRNISNKIHYNQPTINSFSKTKYYLVTYIIITSTLVALYGDFMYTKNIDLETSSKKEIQNNRRGSYELVNRNHFRKEFLTNKKLLKQQIIAKNVILANAKIDSVNTATNTTQDLNTTSNPTNSLKANIFKMGENNEVIKVKVAFLSQTEIDNYLNTISDSLNIISE